MAAIDKYTRTTEKGTAWPLSKSERAHERALTPAWTGFYCFSGHITWRMVLIYYAQVHCLLQTTKDRMLLITSKRRMLQLKGESGQTGYTLYLGGLAQTLGS